MIGAGILHGDLVTVDPDTAMQAGCVAVVTLHQPLLKRVCVENGKVVLRSANPAYPELVVEPPSWIDVLGKVVSVTRKF